MIFFYAIVDILGETRTIRIGIGMRLVTEATGTTKVYKEDSANSEGAKGSDGPVGSEDSA